MIYITDENGDLIPVAESKAIPTWTGKKADLTDEVVQSLDVGTYVNVTDDGNGEVYSTEERIVGTWIDGKPLYRRVFTNVSHQQYILLGQNKFRPVRVEIYHYPSNGLCPMAYNDISKSTDAYSAYLWEDSTGWRVDAFGYVNKLLVIVEYTKTN